MLPLFFSCSMQQNNCHLYLFLFIMFCYRHGSDKSFHLQILKQYLMTRKMEFYNPCPVRNSQNLPPRSNPFLVFVLFQTSCTSCLSVRNKWRHFHNLTLSQRINRAWRPLLNNNCIMHSESRAPSLTLLHPNLPINK